MLTENINFTVCIIKLRSLRLRIMKLAIFRLFSLLQLTKCDDYIGTVAFEMKLLMNDEWQCERKTIDDDGCNRSSGWLRWPINVKSGQTDWRQVIENVHLKSPSLSSNSLSLCPNIWLFTQIFESFLKVEKSRIFAFLEKT